MNVATINEPIEQAKAKFAEYRAAVRARHNQEDELLMRAYRELAAGKRLINLVDVMRLAGMDEKDRPRLAIARANAARVWFCHNGDEWSFGSAKETRRGLGRHHRRRRAERIGLPTATFTTKGARQKTWSQITAIVPTIPPPLRPAEEKIPRYHILWEAEWETVPVDPLLLKHVGRYIYAIVAEWNLTPLEQQVLASATIPRE